MDSRQGSGPSRRTQMVSTEIRSVLTDLLLREIRDPRLQRVGMITISGIDLADDFRNATVWVSFMGKEKESKEVQDAMTALQSAASFMHRALVRKIPLKCHPQLYFKYDPMFEKAAVVQNAFNELQTLSTDPEKNKKDEREDT